MFLTIYPCYANYTIINQSHNCNAKLPNIVHVDPNRGLKSPFKVVSFSCKYNPRLSIFHVSKLYAYRISETSFIWSEQYLSSHNVNRSYVLWEKKYDYANVDLLLLKWFKNNSTHHICIIGDVIINVCQRMTYYWYDISRTRYWHGKTGPTGIQIGKRIFAVETLQTCGVGQDNIGKKLKHLRHSEAHNIEY